MMGVFGSLLAAVAIVLFIIGRFASNESTTRYGETAAAPRTVLNRFALGTVGATVLFLGFGSFTTVDAGEVVVPVQFGAVQEPLTNQGVNFKSPFAGTVAMPIRTVEITFEREGSQEDVSNLGEINALTAEGAQVGVDATVQYHIDPTATARVYATVGTQWEEVLVLPRVRNVVRDCLPNYTFEQARTTQRGEASDCMLNALQAALAPRGIIIEAVLLRDMRASSELQKAIDDKLEAQTNEQKALFEQREAIVRAETARIEAEGRANAAIEAARGEAAAITAVADAEAYANNVIAASLTDQLLQLRIYEQLGDKTVVITDGSSTAPLPILPLGE